MDIVNLSEISGKYRYILDRANFEYDRAVQNATFMLNEHLSDSDDSFFKSDLYSELFEKIRNARLECWSINMGVAIDAIQKITNDKALDGKVVVPSFYKYEYDKTFHEYRLIYDL